LEIHLLASDDHTKQPALEGNTGPIEPLVFQRVAVGGTFDHLHAGHKILLTMTALLAKQSMVVGVTDDCMLVKKKHRELIASTQQRVEFVKEYLYKVKRSITYVVVPIKDPFGPTVTDPTIDALVVSKETLKGGDLGMFIKKNI
jgi:pantetheine-phosphate adenylyltransferase